MTIPRIAAYPMPTEAELPENRVSWVAEPAHAALLIHDMQDYFVDFFDRAAAPVPTLLANIRALRDAADRAGVPVFYSAQPAVQSAAERGLLTEMWGPGLTAQPPQAAAVVAALRPEPQHQVLTKWRYSAFVRSGLAEAMQADGRDQLIICGVYAHIGVLMSCADAFMRDIRPILVADAVADFSAAQHRMALDYVAQRCGSVSTTSALCAALQAALPASVEALRAEVAALLEVAQEELALDDNLLYCGLDSIRLFSLVERWRRAGATLSFVDLAERPTLAQWWEVLSDARSHA